MGERANFSGLRWLIDGCVHCAFLYRGMSIGEKQYSCYLTACSIDSVAALGVEVAQNTQVTCIFCLSEATP